ncbi:MAG: undecaprenyl-diphosphate phosphatase [Nocardioidaceae bacterium]
MNYFEAVVLGVVEGLTEFLPVSSTGHLMIAEKLLGLPIDDATAQGRSVGAYTAVIQMGAIAAVLVYFRRDIWRIARAWFAGLVDPEPRGTLDHRMGWYVIVGSLPIGVVGFLAKDLIRGPFKSLWVVAIALIVWSAVMLWAERVGRQNRDESGLTLRDAVVMGLLQCIALVPGVSRSGATISAGLFVGLDRVTATRLAFFLGIPSLTAAGLYELKDVQGIGAGPAIVGTVVAFVVAYASIAWLLRLVAHRSIGWFVPYRVGLGALLVVLLGAGVMSAT